MKQVRYIFAGIAAACAILAAETRTAIVVAHYGSSDDETRQRTISLITDEFRDAFSGIEMREAYISPVVRRNLAARGITSQSPASSLQQLQAEGYDTVMVQSTTLLEGAEMAEVRKAVRDHEHLFQSLTVGNPLCFSADDCHQLAQLLVREQPAEGEAIVWVGHGNSLPSTATYSQLDYMLHRLGVRDVHVSTIEGFPTAESTIHELKDNPQIRKVILRPLLLVCGNHTRNDIAGEFAETLRDAGYEVEVVFRGLAEDPAIRNLFITKAQGLGL